MKKLLGLGASVLAVLLALEPASSMKAAGEALKMCGQTLLPSLFPFFVCANVLIGSGMTAAFGRALHRPCRRLFGIGGEGASAIFLGFISGYPAGAAVTCRLFSAGSITRTEAQRLLAFTNNGGPLFVIGVIGVGVYGRAETGYLLLAAQTLAALTTGLCMRFYGREEHTGRRQTAPRFGDPIGDAVRTLLSLCGFVVFCATVVAFLEKLGILEMLRRLLVGMGMGVNTATLLSRGIWEITEAAGGGIAALPAMAALLSFGGFSVFLQTLSLVRKAGLSIKSYAYGKLLSTGFAAFYCRILLAVFPLSQSVSLSIESKKAVLFGGYLGTAALLSAAVYGLYVCLGKIRM